MELQLIKQRFLSIFIVMALGCMFSCQRAPHEIPDETILVNIDGKATISKNEFIRRAEYTIRPPYCSGDTYLHKKIILNSLIAEKLLALEAGDTCALAREDEFRHFVTGRKEQAMRQWMRHVEATEKVKVDSSEINTYYKYAGREYEIAYFSLKDTAALKRIQTRGKVDIFTANSRLPTRKLRWNQSEPFPVLHALFSKDVKQGQVLPPINVKNDEILLVKVLGWSDTKAMTSQQMHERFRQVDERLTAQKAGDIWNEIRSEIMRGKTLDFNRPVFKRVSELYHKLYFKSSAQKKDALKEHIWNMEQDSALALDKADLQQLLQQPLLTIDGQVWTVDNFRTELMSHPLVFRNRHMPSSEFATEFRLAIVDLVRDHYVTRHAYQKGYDQVPVVRRTANMWRDAYLALYQKQKYLKSIQENRPFGTHFMEIIGAHLNDYVDSLQQKYHHKIELNVNEFESIPLTRIDVLVKQQDQPYQYVVPKFPILTTDHLIEYTTKMHGM